MVKKKKITKPAEAPPPYSSIFAYPKFIQELTDGKKHSKDRTIKEPERRPLV